MKRILFCLSLTAALLVSLSGCAPILGRTYSAEAPHVSNAGAAENALSADSFESLVGALLSCIARHEEDCSIQLVWPEEDPTELIRAACEEITETEPLGIYAVEDISFDVVRIVSYYEAAFTIRYLHTEEEMGTLRNAVGTYGVRQALSEALAAFRTTLTLNTTYYTGDRAAIEALVRQAYEEQPMSALGLQSVTVEFYPEEGSNRILALTFDYGQDTEALAARQAELRAHVRSVTAEGSAAEKARTLCQSLYGNATYAAPEGTPPFCASAWDALCGGGGSDESFALAFACLCRAQGIECAVIRGTRGGTAWVWNAVTDAEGTVYHVDAARGIGPETENQFKSAGYAWE